MKKSEIINRKLLAVTNKLKTKDGRTLVSNFSYLTIIEVSNYILPFLAIPYIVRVVGIEKYGVIMFAYAVIIYFNLITNFGFKLLATKYISLNRDDIKKVSKYFWTVLTSQFLLLLLSSFLFFILLFNVEMLHKEKTVFLYAFGTVIANVLFPIWFFQGMEKMKFIAIFNLLNRLIYTVSIFLLINSPEDYTLIPLINSVSFLLIGLGSLIFIHGKFKITFVSVYLADIKTLFVEGWHLFLATIANNLYTSTNTVLLGVMTNYTAVGIFSIAVTISGAITKIIKIYSSVTFPYIAKFANDKVKLVYKAQLLFRYYVLILIFVSFGTYISAEYVITFVFGENHDESILILKVLALTILVEPLGAFFTTYLVIKDQAKLVSKITFFTMIVNFILILPLLFFFQALGMAITKVIVESFQVFMNLRYNKELIDLKRKDK